MNTEQAIEIIKSIQLNEELRSICLTALRAQQERESPRPLTLEGVRRLKGSPIWLSEPGKQPVCVTYHSEDETIIRFIPFGVDVTMSFGKGGVNMVFALYAHEPKEAHESYEDCNFEEKGLCLAACCYTSTKCAARDENGNPNYRYEPKEA